MQTLVYTDEKTDNRFFQLVLWFQPSDGVLLVDEQDDQVHITAFLDPRYATIPHTIPDHQLVAIFWKEVVHDRVVRQGALQPLLEQLIDPSQLRIDGSHLPYAVAQRRLALWPEAHIATERNGQTRLIKTPHQLAHIKSAVEKTVLLFQWLEGLIASGALLGKTERAVRMLLTTKALDYGLEDEAFPAIVATNAHSAIPHHHSDMTHISAGPLLIDMGYRFEWRCSDLTRTYRIGAPDERYDEFQRVHAKVREAHDAAITGCRVGSAISHVETLARTVLADAQLAEYFTHSIGHGVWLDVHEQPYLHAKNTQSFAAGMVCTIEPGVYLPDQRGVRYETDVIITEAGAEVLGGV
jgi:Xaa-Pro aminopeptidase